MVGLPPEARPLRVPGADWAVLDLPTGRIILVSGHNDIMGSVDNLRELARAMLAACDQAEQFTEASVWPSGLLHMRRLTGDS